MNPRGYNLQDLTMRLFAILMTLLLLVILLHAAQADVASLCPVGCYCPSVLKVDCSSRGFERVPLNLSIDTRILNVSNNSISKLGNDTFTSGSLPYLKVLDIHRNNISRIDVESFTTLENLAFVYLEENSLSTIQKELFSGNSELEILSIRHNPLRIPQKGPFLSIPSLLDLDISYCNITSLYAKTFVSLRKLEILRASHNSLNTLSKEVFMPLKSLKQLYLSHNNISTIEYNLFSPMKLLTLLDLSHNKLQELLHLTFFRQSSLQVLYLSSNKLSSISEDEFNSLLSLKELYLQNNSLSSIEENLFRSTINLHVLYLDNNLLSNLSTETFSSLESLTHLYLSGNRFKTFSLRWVCKLNGLKFLRVFDNPVRCDCDMKNLWNWAKDKGLSLWGSCVQKKKRIVHGNADVPVVLASLKCNVTSCDVEPVFPQIDTHLTLVYILSAVCPLLLFVLCFVCAAWVFTRHRKNARELRNRQYKAPTSSTGYLILDTLPRVQMYSSSVREEGDSLDSLKAHTEPVVIENHHAFVSPYSVSPVLAVGPCPSVSTAPPPVPLRPPSDLILSTMPQCYPEDNMVRGATTFSSLPQYPECNVVRGGAFSTSEEEESRPLMKHYRSATMSKESSIGVRQPKRIRPRRHHNNHSASDTEPWSSYSEGSGSVSITECDVACWSGSEPSTRPASVGIADIPDA